MAGNVDAVVWMQLGEHAKKNPAGAGFFRVTLRLAEHDGAALTYQLQQPLLRDGLQRGQLR